VVGSAGVAFPAVSFPLRNGAQGGKPEGSRNKRSVVLASLIAVSPPAFEQEDSSGSVGGWDAGLRAKGKIVGVGIECEGGG